MVHGADFSSYQDDAALQRALDRGLGFAFVKLTEGPGPGLPHGYLNPRAGHQLEVLRAHGLRLGVYHYLDAAGPLAQWHEFQAHLETLPHHGELLLVVDYEQAGTTAAEARGFVADGRKAGYQVGLYHSQSGYPKLGQAFNWVAKWSTIAPPAPWAFWQFAPGRGGDPDWDVFHGDKTRLALFWHAHAGRRPTRRYHVTFPAAGKLPLVTLGPFRRLRKAAAAALAYALRHPRRPSYTITRTGGRR